MVMFEVVVVRKIGLSGGSREPGMHGVLPEPEQGKAPLR